MKTAAFSEPDINKRLNYSLARLDMFLGSVPAPILAICTGTSGPKSLVARLAPRKHASFEQLGFPVPSALGHVGTLHYGTLHGMPTVILEGRTHYFENASMHGVVHAVRSLCLLGVTHFIFTNAAGTLHPDHEVGDILFISDHVNNMGASPLRGFPTELTIMRDGHDTKELQMERFVGMHDAYDRSWREQCEKKLGMLSPRNAIYTAVHGPEFETPAEIERKYRLQADLIGMSTVPEVIAVRQFGAKVLGISLVTNLTGTRAKTITHDDNLGVVRQADGALTDIIDRCAEVLSLSVLPKELAKVE